MKFLALILLTLILNACNSLNYFNFSSINNIDLDIVKLSQKLEHDPNNINLLTKVANFHKNNHDCEAFEDIYKKIKFHPQFELANNLELNNFEAKCQINALKLKSAYETLNVTLKHEAANPEALTNLGLILTLTGNYNEAEVYQQYALDHDATNPIILNNSGILAFYQHNYFKAYHLFESAFYLAGSKQKMQILPNLLNVMSLIHKHKEVKTLMAEYYQESEQQNILKELKILNKTGFKPNVIEFK